MRLATWNVNSLSMRLPLVLEWMQANTPDILCMQETKLSDEAFPSEAFAKLGYESAHHGDGRWNGVGILSRVGLEHPECGMGPAEDAHGCRLLAATCGGIRIHSVYVPNGRNVDSEHYASKLEWLAGLRRYLDERCDPASPVAVCGDFNIAPDDRDVWDPAHFVGMTHVSKPERDALAVIEQWGLEDVFRRFHSEGGVFSWWDYRAGNFHKGYGMRIDLVLLSSVLAGRASGVEIDRNARKKSAAGNKPSDHTVVVAELDWPPDA